MTRVLALALVALLVVLAIAASAPLAATAPDELRQVVPWPLSVAAAPDAAMRVLATPASIAPAAAPTTAPTTSPTPSPAVVDTLFARMLLTPPASFRLHGAAHLNTRELPALEQIGTPGSAPPSDAPTRPYLERLLSGEEVEGWKWDAGLDAQPAAELQDSSLNDSLSLDFDARLQNTTVKDEQGDYVQAVMVGPKMRWRPSRSTQLEFSPLVGVGSPYPMSEAVVAFGWRF